MIEIDYRRAGIRGTQDHSSYEAGNLGNQDISIRESIIMQMIKNEEHD